MTLFLRFLWHFTPLFYRFVKIFKMDGQVKETSSSDYIMFVISLIAFIGLLIFANEWFWLAMPTLLTSLVKILRVI